jgi:formylglycine-generating enzyme required for sulfatase activity
MNRPRWSILASGAAVWALMQVPAIAATPPMGVMSGVTEAGESVWVQVASHGPGLHGSQWRTDLGLRNIGNVQAAVEVRLHPPDGGPVRSDTALVAPGAQSVLEDVAFQLGFTGSGALEVRSVVPVIVTSRTYALVPAGAPCTPGGTFGQFYPAFRVPDGLAAGQTAWLPHLAESTRFRSNLAFTNTGTAAATVQVELFDGAGSRLTGFSVALNSAQYRQEVQPYRNRAGQTAMARGSARVKVVAGTGVIISASVVDNLTNDPTTIPATPVEESVPEQITVILPDDTPLFLLKVPAGTFLMGSPPDERGRSMYEGPQHQVTLTRPFFIGKLEVTQEQWVALMGSNPSENAACGPNCPVENVSWSDICGSGAACGDSPGFIKALNDHLVATGQHGAGLFRLPTEAEWEYAARAGTTTRFAHGDVLECDDQCGACAAHDPYLWWCGNAGGTTHPGKQKQANPFGLHDMHGNVLEWVNDWWTSAYPAGPVIDPQGPESGAERVLRGGGFFFYSQYSRSAYRAPASPETREVHYGFRVARSESFE